MRLLLFLFLPVALSAILTGAMWRYAMLHRLFDIPNERSSHLIPTPRGGGVAIVFVVLAGLVWQFLVGDLQAGIFRALAEGSLMVAVIGYLDDRGHVPASWRLVAHLCACLWAVHYLVPLPELEVSVLQITLGWPGTLILVLGMAWILNLYNFMDGIDGIAGVQGLTVGGLFAGMYWWSGAVDLAVVSALVAAACVGFLLWNWPPAKIFMGDVGSGFLGFIFATLVVVAFATHVLTLWAGLIPLGVFIVDGTWTLLCRFVNRQPLYVAHCSHGYQHAAIEFNSHRAVTIAVGTINLLWLTPLACWAVLRPEFGPLALTIAWLPLLILCVRFRAGLTE